MEPGSRCKYCFQQKAFVSQQYVGDIVTRKGLMRSESVSSFFFIINVLSIFFPVSDVYPRPTRRTKRTVYWRTGSYYEIPFSYGKLQRCCTSSNEFPESQKYSNFLLRSSRDVRAGLVPEWRHLREARD